jgi:hypothetical protein
MMMSRAQMPPRILAVRPGLATVNLVLRSHVFQTQSLLPVLDLQARWEAAALSTPMPGKTVVQRWANGYGDGVLRRFT